MRKRQPNGTWRSARQPVVVSAAVLRARWVEAETIRLKCFGLTSFDAVLGWTQPRSNGFISRASDGDHDHRKQELREGPK
jgi:hypothetical protein